MIHLKETSDKKFLCESPIFSGLDFRNPWNLENERQRWNVFFAVNLHVISASLLWSSIFVLVQFHLDSDFVSAESMITCLSECIRQYPSGFRKRWASPLSCVFLGCSMKKRLKRDCPLRLLLEACPCIPGTTFSLHLWSPSIPGKVHVEERTAEHSSWKDHHVVPYWIVWMHTPGVHMPARSKIKRENRKCINPLSHTLILSFTELAKIVQLFTQYQQMMKFTLSRVTGVWNKS